MYRTADPKVFGAQPQYKFGKHVTTQASNSVHSNMKKLLIVWMIFDCKLLCLFLMSAIFSFLMYLCYRTTQTSNGNSENIQPRFGSSRRDSFFDPSRPLFGSRPILLEPLIGYSKIVFDVFPIPIVVTFCLR